MALRDGQPFAGIESIEDRIPETSESLWLAAISVTDTAQSVATAKRPGVTIRQDVTELAGWETYSLELRRARAPASRAAAARLADLAAPNSGWRWAELWTPDTKAAADP